MMMINMRYVNEVTMSRQCQKPFTLRVMKRDELLALTDMMGLLFSRSCGRACDSRMVARWQL